MPSLYLWIAALVIAASAFGGTYFKGRTDGKEVVQEQWDAATAKSIIEAEKIRSENQTAIREAEKKFAARAAKSKVVTRTIIEKVDHYVPTTTPLLPGGFRLLHDAAAAGVEVGDTYQPDDSPVSPGTVTRTVANNYAACREDQDKLEALQAIIKSINGDEP